MTVYMSMSVLFLLRSCLSHVFDSNEEIKDFTGKRMIAVNDYGLIGDLLNNDSHRTV